MAKAECKKADSRFLLVALAVAGCVGLETGSSAGQQLAVTTDQPVSGQSASGPRRPSAKVTAMASAATPDAVSTPDQVRPVRRSQAGISARGPYYVDFRARTAASYGHAFVWFGKTSEKKVDVAGLHPAGDEVPYMLGHLTWVPSETGASYGDLDVQYLTASYRVYLNEEDAKKTFAYIRHLQATSPLWNAETTNCTAFIGQIASFMGLKTPFHLQKPEAYVNQLKEMNGGRQTAQLSSDH